MPYYQLAHMSRTVAERWFATKYADVVAGPDNLAKRRAWAACIDQLIKEDGAPANAKYWQYPTRFDTPCKP